MRRGSLNTLGIANSWASDVFYPQGCRRTSIGCLIVTLGGDRSCGTTTSRTSGLLERSARSMVDIAKLLRWSQSGSVCKSLRSWMFFMNHEALAIILKVMLWSFSSASMLVVGAVAQTADP
ncbi:hypothetical protein QE152_g26317 [Popillia japonica]|uniref:Uncharacterized protein n=1 Tax=Popillia japonica TaxID=7064 RepID=A0AAW1JYP7_POPJA